MIYLRGGRSADRWGRLPLAYLRALNRCRAYPLRLIQHNGRAGRVGSYPAGASFPGHGLAPVPHLPRADCARPRGLS